MSKRTWLLLLLAFAAEFVLFDRMTSRHWAWVYPRWDDQVQPLTEAYTGYEFRRAHGLGPGLWHVLAEPAAQGDLQAFWALLVFEAAGRASRSAALAVNMIAFLAWQAALAWAILSRVRSRALAWTAIGLTLALGRPWETLQGTATDFRLDHVAMCLMGVSLALALRTEGFRARKASLAFGLAVGVTLLERYLTATYFAVIFAGALAWVLCSPDRGRRALHLALAGAVAAAVALPCLWHNGAAVYAHYWIGHYVNADAAFWDLHLSLGQSLGRFWSHLLGEQAGAAFWIAAGAALAVWAAFGLGRGGAPAAAARADRRWAREAAMLGALFLAGPAVVLPLQNQEFFAVLGVALPGLIVLVLALGAWLRSGVGERFAPPAAARISAAAALAALAVGAGNFALRELAAPYGPQFAFDARQVNLLADSIFFQARQHYPDHPKVATDAVLDFCSAPILRVLGYERHGFWLPFEITLPYTITAIPKAEVMAQVARSDFVVLTAAGAPGPWPYDHEMATLRPELAAWCERHLEPAGRVSAEGRTFALYRRPDSAAAP